MKIARLSLEKRAAVILGAGATRGASCFKNTWKVPPLDGDFFSKIQMIADELPGGESAELLSLARSEFGEELDVSMEKFFTQIEFLDTFHRDLRIRGPRVRRYDDILRNYVGTIASVFGAILLESNGREKSCDYHDALAAALQPRDVILSFNYDCLMDRALQKHSGKRWSAGRGYGFEIKKGIEGWQNRAGKGRIAKESILLLKMHGSLNWDRRWRGYTKLRSEPYTSDVRGSNEIIPPIWNKDIAGDNKLAGVWKMARMALRRGPILLVVGYSVPETDLLSQALIRVATSEGSRKLSHLIIANPDLEARARVKRLVRKAIGDRTRVIELETFEELAELLRP
ncbi:MAG: SIR2 family protein [Candidatus Omnitrophica bacterium]|nr:SIR2 family protein [Candidatus Omnitrophota bacterium]